MIVKVAVLNRGAIGEKQFDYISAQAILPGIRVNVPFAGGKAVGLVLSVSSNSDVPESKLKKITSIIDEKPVLDSVMISTAKFISERYVCSLADALTLFFPKGENIKNHTQKVVVLKNFSRGKQWLNKQRKNAFVRIEIIKTLLENKKIKYDDLKKKFSASALNIINVLKDEDIVYIEEFSYQREYKKSVTMDNGTVLSEEQQKALFELLNMYEQNEKRPVLLHGVTGSGKTELYIKIIERVLQDGKEAIVLVPEIALTSQISHRFRERFGSAVAIMHSGLNDRKKNEMWQMMKNGVSPIVIGARSALFAPYKNIGAVIVDECHEETYRSQMSPRYDAVETAIFLSKQRNSLIVLGSATPTVEQYNLSEKGDFKKITLLKRVNGADFPEINFVDMMEEIKSGNNNMLSILLFDEIKRNLGEYKQTILFLNRRGYSNVLTCDKCGYVHKCPHCDITLSYHKEDNLFKCHYCGYKADYDKKCPECAVGEMRNMTYGIQRLEEELKKFFPDSRILRMDRDTTQKKGAHEKYIQSFYNGEFDILIGTQMIGKGLDFPNVTLVGILQSDSSLNIPDFRSNERTFQMLLQVTGRAGRGEAGAKAIVQALSTEHFVFKYFKTHDYVGFYNQELKIRKAFAYPPFGNIIRILFSSTDMKKAGDAAQKSKDALKYLVRKKKIKSYDILNATPCLINRIENKYRWQIIIKIFDDKTEEKIKKILKYLFWQKRKLLFDKNVTVAVEYNPTAIL